MESISLAEAVQILNQLTPDLFSKRLDYNNSSREYIEEPPSGFRLDFEKRYEELKQLVLESEKIKRSDLPSFERHHHLREIEQKVKSPKYQDKIKIQQLETMLNNLLDLYHLLSVKHSNPTKLSEIRSRIHDCRRKIQMLKAKVK